MLQRCFNMREADCTFASSILRKQDGTSSWKKKMRHQWGNISNIPLEIIGKVVVPAQ